MYKEGTYTYVEYSGWLFSIKKVTAFEEFDERFDTPFDLKNTLLIKLNDCLIDTYLREDYTLRAFIGKITL